MEASNDVMFVVLFCLISCLVVARKESSFESEDETKLIANRSRTLKLSSFLSSSTCRPSTYGDKKRGSLEVFHRRGPCSRFNEDNTKPLKIEEIFSRDQSRVNSIRSTMTIKKGEKETDNSKASLPTKPDSSYGEYLVTVGLGTPTQYVTLILDTGSDQTWTQCQPCAVYCYKQQQPIFAPSSSTTYSNISCTECSELTSATKRLLSCNSSTCDYSIQYVDKSITTGFLGKEKLTLTPNDVIDGFVFGCGQNQQGLYGGAAGLMGLGSGTLSFVSQTAEKYKKAFSYCLPSTASSTGYLTFGRIDSNSNNVAYTPLSMTSQDSTYYSLDLEAIEVGGTKLEISPMVFKTSGMIIDSGTTLTFLPPTAYSALRNAFRAEMTRYPLTNGVSPFDTCYDLSKCSNVTLPNIRMVWGGNVNVDIPTQGILYPIGGQVYCLGFVGNGDDTDLGIFGNTQQMTLEVVYDVTAGKVGFAPGGCA